MINNRKIVKFYEDSLREHGDTAEGMHWKDKSSQALRFAMLTQFKFSPGCTLLDVGCGMGHLYEFLEKKKQAQYLTYYGIDITKKMAHGAKKKYPHLSFGAHDIFALNYMEFDFIVCSGAFNTLLGHDRTEWANHCKKTIARMFEICKVGIAFNMLSSYNDFEEPDYYYVDPMEYFALAKTMSRSVTLRHDYPLFEWTMYIYKMGEI